MNKKEKDKLVRTINRSISDMFENHYNMKAYASGAYPNNSYAEEYYKAADKFSSCITKLVDAIPED